MQKWQTLKELNRKSVSPSFLIFSDSPPPGEKIKIYSPPFKTGGGGGGGANYENSSDN